MKRLTAVVLALAMFVSMALILPSASAAEKDLVYDRDATLSASFVTYHNITVKSGAHVVVTSGSGFEISGSITVEPGGSFTCSGVGKGDFNFSMKSGTADITGMDLYYKHKEADGSITIRRVDGGYPAIAALDVFNFAPSGGWYPSFKWDSSVNGWCLTLALNVNLSNLKPTHSERDMDMAKQYADRLNGLGLFKGTGTLPDGTPNYELNRAPTRCEALVMLIRLLGREDEAENGDWSHPFTDVPAWADKYVGYAYENGLTRGVSDTSFGTGNASAQQYLTFVLRALGYPEDITSAGLYNDAMDFAHRTGLTVDTEEDVYVFDTNRFWRADAVAASYRALNAELYAGGKLYEKLISDGVFTAEDWNRYQ